MPPRAHLGIVVRAAGRYTVATPPEHAQVVLCVAECLVVVVAVVVGVMVGMMVVAVVVGMLVDGGVVVRSEPWGRFIRRRSSGVVRVRTRSSPPPCPLLESTYQTGRRYTYQKVHLPDPAG